MPIVILATEAATTAPGDAYQTAAYALLGIAMLVTAIATLIVTPKMEKH